MSLLFLLLLGLFSLSFAETVTYNWDITWVNANPDGRLVRPVIGINDKWPCPQLTANVGDTVVVNVHNQLGNETTGIHFHGLYQQGSVASDGPIGVVQCPIPPGGSFTYKFEVNQPGTYWYHSHASGQYPDGLRGPLIIYDPQSPYMNHYDEELVLTISDWYHDQMPGLVNYYLSADRNQFGYEPVPYSALFNDDQNITLRFTPGKTYLLRIISMAAFSATVLRFDDHPMTVIEVDGIYTEKKTTDTIIVTAAQRYGVLIKAKENPDRNYAFIGHFDETMFNYHPDYLIPRVKGYLVYDKHKTLPQPPRIDNATYLDDFGLVPYDRMPRLAPAKQTIPLDFLFTVIDNQNRATFNNVTYLEQEVPTLYTALSVGKFATNPVVYGVNSNAHVLHHNNVIDIILNNFDSGGHPFHLHGHTFQVLERSGPNQLPWNGDTSHFPEIPMRRDTIMVQQGGYVILRFKADNPGVWFFHCHIDWHLVAGLAATMIEAPLVLQKTQSVPAGDIQVCKNQGLPYAGNAAGNTKNVTDLRGAITDPPPNPMGALINSTKSAP